VTIKLTEYEQSEINRLVSGGDHPFEAHIKILERQIAYYKSICDSRNEELERSRDLRAALRKFLS